MDERVVRIRQIAEALIDSDGSNGAGASTGERIAGALAAGHPEWAGYTDGEGATDVFALIERLGPEWYRLAREAWLQLEESRNAY